MRRAKRKPPIVLERSWPLKYASLRNVVAVLNDRPRSMSESDHARLARLVELWASSGPDWSNFAYWQQNGVSVDRLAREIDSAISVEIRLPPGPRAHLEITNNVLTRVTGKERDDALYLFATLVLDPDWEYWGGRCKQCRKFYVKETRGQNVYCSPECKSRRPSKEYKQDARKRAHAKILGIVREKIAAYEKLSSGQRRRHPIWQDWVVSEVNAKLRAEGSISRKWITRNKVSPPAS